MPKLLYCWRCRVDVPMLEDAEWEQVVPHLENAVAQIKDFRKVHNVSLAEAECT
jgi:hypothetical protein